MMHGSVARWAVWLLTLALLCAFALWRMDPSGPLQTNVVSLLPSHEENALLEAARQRNDHAFSQRLLAVVEGPADGSVQVAATAAQQALRQAGMDDNDALDGFAKALDLYRSHGPALLSPDNIARFQQQGARALAVDVAVSLASPSGVVSGMQDPGGHVADFIAHLPRPYPEFNPEHGMLVAQRGDNRVYLLQMQLSEAAFGVAGSKTAVSAVDAAARAVAETCRDCTFTATGAALFTDAARRVAHKESMVLSLASTLLIMVLIAWAYRSLAPHLLGFLQLGASVLAAAAAVIAVFGSIHVITLVFGTTLLGIAIDYAFLYFSEYWFGSGRPESVWQRVRPGLLVGLLTGVLAFAFLGLTGLPALSQMAVFSAAGLLEAALVVAWIFPQVLNKPPRVATHALVRWPARFLERATRPSRWRYVLPLLALLLAAPGWWQLQSRDDVRELSYFPPELMQNDQDVRNALGQSPAPGFYLIAGRTLEQALARETDLLQRFGQQQPDATFIGLSRYVPATSRQQASLSAWQQVMAAPEALREAFRATGLPAQLADHMVASWQAQQHEVLRVQALLGAVPALSKFIVHGDDRVALTATVFSDQSLDGAALSGLADGLPGVEFIQPVQRVDDTLRHVRVRANWLVVMGYLLISALLLWRYGWREGLRMLFPPLLALALTLGTLGWLGAPLNVFSVVALILILGLGRDYAVFLREAGAGQRSAALAVMLSALTTLIGFGLLIFSRIPALHAFGLATGIGILASWLVTPLSLPPTQSAATPREHKT